MAQIICKPLEVIRFCIINNECLRESCVFAVEHLSAVSINLDDEVAFLGKLHHALHNEKHTSIELFVPEQVFRDGVISSQECRLRDHKQIIRKRHGHCTEVVLLVHLQLTSLHGVCDRIKQFFCGNSVCGNQVPAAVIVKRMGQSPCPIKVVSVAFIIDKNHLNFPIIMVSRNLCDHIFDQAKCVCAIPYNPAYLIFQDTAGNRSVTDSTIFLTDFFRTLLQLIVFQ